MALDAAARAEIRAQPAALPALAALLVGRDTQVGGRGGQAGGQAGRWSRTPSWWRQLPTLSQLPTCAPVLQAAVCAAGTLANLANLHEGGGGAAAERRGALVEALAEALAAAAVYHSCGQQGAWPDPLGDVHSDE